MGSTTQEIDAYLENLAPERRAALARLRSLIRETVPAALETMKYTMPTYEYEDQMLCAFASQKHYLSLYMDVDVVAAHKSELAHLNLGKSCIRFKRIEDLPLDTVTLMLEETVQKLR